MGWIITHILAIIGAAGGWFNPFLGLMVYYWFAILRPPYLWFWAFDPWTTPRFSLYVGLSTLAGWAFSGFGSFQGLRGTRLAITGLLIYLFSGIVAWQFYAIAPWMCEIVLDTQVKIVFMLIVTLSIVRDARSILIFIWIVLISLGYLGWVLNDWYFINPMYLHNHGFGAVDNNGVGMIMVVSIPLCFFMAVYDKRIWLRAICFFAVACQVHVILFSYSRGSQLGLCMIGAFILYFAIMHLPRKMLTVGCTLIFIYITLQMAGEGVRQRFMSIFAEDLDASAESRFSTWGGAIECIKQFPMGVGPRNFGFHSQNFGLSQGKAVHNLFLQTGADYGIIGMLGLILFYLATFVNTVLMSRSVVAKALVWPRYVGLACCTSIGGFLICSMFIGMESVEAGYIICALGLATTAYVNRVIDASPAGYAVNIPELVHVPDPSEEFHERTLPRPGTLRPSLA